MRRANARRVVYALTLCGGVISLALLKQVGPSMAETAAAPRPAETIASDRNAATTEDDKVKAEVAKIEAETSALKAIGDQTRWWTTVLTAVGSIVGAIVGGVFTFVVTQMGQRFSRLQRERQKDDEILTRQKMRQEQEQAQEMHHLRLFQDLGHQSHRARLAAAAVLLDRLRRLREAKSPEADGTARLIGKVLVAVLKRQSTAAEKPAADAASRESPTESVAADVTDESEASLRKYIADELVETLGVRFKPGEGPKEPGKSLLGMDRDFQKCDLGDVYWAYVDARGVDFFQSDFAEASLRGAALQGAVFYKANLRKAILFGADLRDANFREADLRGANLQEADLRGARLENAKL